MHLHIDQYADRESLLHRWNPRHKFIALFSLIILFSLVQDLRLIPFMLAITAVVFTLSKLPLHFLVSRLRYPGMFLLVLIVMLPLFTGQTVIMQLGPLNVRAEGLEYMLLVVTRFVSILTMSLVIFGTTTFIVTVRTFRTLGIPALLADMLLLTMRYIFEFADTLTRMQRAMHMRGFVLTRINRRGASQLAGLVGSLLVRSFEQAERVYNAMRMRGYGATANDKEMVLHMTDYEAGHAGLPALALENVEFAYPDRPPALRGVSLHIVHGERVGLIGPNGAGKTSLFLTVCGILKPNAGSVTVYDQAVVSGKYHPAIGLVFQNTDDQLFSPTVREDVAFGPVNLGLNDADVQVRTEEALKLTGMEHLAERAPHHLSGGEKRMVSIAGVLAMKPGLVLYDEPDANLDMRARRRLIRFLQTAPHTLIVASHDLEMILEVCDRVILLDGGQIIADGDPAHVMGNAALMELHGLEKPHSLVPHLHADGSYHTATRTNGQAVQAPAQTG